MDQPWGGYVLGICKFCGAEKWHPAVLAEDAPMRERHAGAKAVRQQKELNEAKRQYQQQKRPWSGDDE